MCAQTLHGEDKVLVVSRTFFDIMRMLILTILLSQPATLDDLSANLASRAAEAAAAANLNKAKSCSSEEKDSDYEDVEFGNNGGEHLTQKIRMIFNSNRSIH